MNINQLKFLIGEFEILVKTISNDSAYIEKMLNCQREIYNGFYEIKLLQLTKENKFNH